LQRPNASVAPLPLAFAAERQKRWTDEVAVAERRTISAHEIDVVRWLLANGAMKDVSEYHAESLEGCEVVSACPCGCASIDFLFPGSTKTAGLRSTSILAEAITRWPDGTQAGVMLWGNEGRLLGIELYEQDPVADRFPTIESLRRWEDYYPLPSPKT
jgi:hypothetical protein